MRYLITGGTGFIGRNFIHNIQGKDNTITILSRQKNIVLNNCRIIQNLAELRHDEKIDCIINLAGKPIDCLWTSANKKELIASRITITQNLLQLVDRLQYKPKTLLSASAVGFYGNMSNKTVDELSVGNHSFTHNLCKEWEENALKISQYGTKVCIMRLGVVLAKNGGFIKKISLPFKLGLGGRIGDGKQFFTWIHLDDVIAAMNFLIHCEDCFGIYNFVAPKLPTNAEMTNYLGSVLQRPTKLHIPAFVIKTIFREMGENLLLQGNNVIPKRLISQQYKFKYEDIISAFNNIYNKK